MAKVRVEKLQELIKQEISDIIFNELKDPRIGFVRREIGRRIRLRFTPEISFALDTSLNYSDHIQRLLNEIHEDKPMAEKEEQE